MTHSRDQRIFNRLLISQQDMERAEEFFKAASAASIAGQMEVCRGLITAGIVAYARPFSENNDHPSTTSSPPFSTRYLTDDERLLHQKMLTLRNKAVAHSDAEYNVTNVAANFSNGFIFSAKFYDPLDESPNIIAMQALAHTAKHLLVHSSFKSSRAIADEG